MNRFKRAIMQLEHLNNSLNAYVPCLAMLQNKTAATIYLITAEINIKNTIELLKRLDEEDHL